MILPQIALRSLVGISLGVFLSILLPGKAAASDNERYKAVPLGPSGVSVFILDTKEGHIWIWTNQGSDIAASGENPRIHYQGTVRQHMKKTHTPSNAPTTPFTRF